jgi:hypothetical protein
MPTPYEQELLEMSRRANAIDVSTEPQLPDLDLQALLSPQAVFEVTAAELLNTPQIDLVRQQGRRMQERIAAQQDATVSSQLTAPPLPSLESIFMASAAREIGMDQVDALAFAISSITDVNSDIGFDLAFDTEEGAAVPNEAARFQVGRESPPYRPFSAQNQSQDGVVVGQRVGGRFEPVRRPEAVREARQSRVYDAPRVRSPAPVVSVDTSPGPAMSALDVVSSNCFDNI